MSEKLQKVLANAGHASRREIERWIEAGRISVNGKRAKLGERVEVDDRIIIDGKPVHVGNQKAEKIQALIYNKPEGEICSRKDEKGRPTVFDSLPSIPNGRWVSVGRLDINTSGLLLFTNNGELANKLMHPSTGLEREYLVRVRGRASEDTINQLVRTGVTIDGKPAKFESVVASDMSEEGTNHWYRVIIKEGRNREVRRMWDAVGHTVSRLKRIRYGTIKLTRDIKLGHIVKMAPMQLEKLVCGLNLEDEFKGQLYSDSRSNNARSPNARQSRGRTSGRRNERDSERPSRSNSRGRVRR